MFIHTRYTKREGFTLIEILIVVAIVTMLAFVSVLSFNAARDASELRATARTLASHLEESKARAVAGTDGVAHGIFFTSDAYTQFSGSSYDAEDETNVSYEIDESLVLTTDIESGDEAVVFSRISGAVSEPVVVTIERIDTPSHYYTVTVGSGGDISLNEYE